MPLCVLDEAEFWKHQEEERTVVIRELVRDLEQEYGGDLKGLGNEFSKAHQHVIEYIETVNCSNGQVIQAPYQDVL